MKIFSKLIRLIFLIFAIYLAKKLYDDLNDQNFQIDNVIENKQKPIEYQTIIIPTEAKIEPQADALKAPLIFIGGFERSGTTLMRAILDVHDSVICGPETKVIPHILNFVRSLLKKKVHRREIRASKLKFKVIYGALGHFIYHIMDNHIRKAPRLCAKDPITLRNMDFLHDIFPNAKFIYMVRNGRGAAYSLLLKRKLQLNFKNYLMLLEKWDIENRNLLNMCNTIGKTRCKVVKYEELVQNKETVLKDIVTYLDLEWSDRLLNHEKFINDKIVLSKMEWSNDQINRSIYTDSLNNWIGKIPNYDEKVIVNRIQMLKVFGYNENINN